MGHLKSSSTSSTKSSSWPEEEQCLFDVDSAMLKVGRIFETNRMQC